MIQSKINGSKKNKIQIVTKRLQNKSLNKDQLLFPKKIKKTVKIIIKKKLNQRLAKL